MKYPGYEKIDITKDERISQANRKINDLMDDSLGNHKQVLKYLRKIKSLFRESIQDKKKIDRLYDRIQTYESILAIVINGNKSRASKSKR